MGAVATFSVRVVHRVFPLTEINCTTNQWIQIGLGIKLSWRTTEPQQLTTVH